MRSFDIAPEDVGLPRAKPEALRGGDAEQNARALLDVLKGKKGAFRDVAVLNAAAGLMVAGRAKDSGARRRLGGEIDRFGRSRRPARPSHRNLERLRTPDGRYPEQDRGL